MQVQRLLILTALLAAAPVAAADMYQLWLERFDEASGTTVCKYRSGAGEDAMSQHEGRYLCPRVACSVPPPNDGRDNQDCLTRDVTSGNVDQRAGPPPVRL
jgi:hypothetical protein